ncbi:MAG: hypothetical protein H6756_03505 [Candidatus Omnitrophica bacterium]|nr:hypothetical protein [Candidatus Omnitrophota bacterium]MCB9719918.1 hypothetical protein [Candidatus Omnitrophota bacterium]
MKKIKERVLEIVEIAKECPDNMQAICFEVLLENMLYGGERQKEVPNQPVPSPNAEQQETKNSVEESSETQEDIQAKDLHVKMKKFLEKNGLTLDNINQLYYKQDGNILPLYDDLKSIKTSESQIRIALLQALQSAITTGEFSFSIEMVRQEAGERKCYDSKNFGTNFTNNATSFDFDKYNREIKEAKLSEQGKKELAGIIKDLQ